MLTVTLPVPHRKAWKCHKSSMLQACPTIISYSNNRAINLDNIFMPESLEKHYAKNQTINEDIDEWIDRAESMT